MANLGNQFPAVQTVERGRAAVGREAALAALRRLISDGDYAPGDRLPPERELIVRLGISRSALRRALEALEREGAIWRHVGKGTFVSSGAEGAGVGGLHEIARQLSPVKMIRARLAIEPAIAKEAALNASGRAVIKISLAHERAQNAGTWEEYEAHDDMMHRAIAEATDNILLLSLFDQLNQVRRAVAWGSVVRRSVRPPADHSSFGEHDAILRAIEARDPAAAQAAMRTHIWSVSARLFPGD